jgi:hypothetical protein
MEPGNKPDKRATEGPGDTLEEHLAGTDALFITCPVGVGSPVYFFGQLGQ